jgi:hypothetical protein
LCCTTDDVVLLEGAFLLVLCDLVSEFAPHFRIKQMMAIAMAVIRIMLITPTIRFVLSRPEMIFN